MPEQHPAVVLDINVSADAILGPDSSWPLLDPVPPSTDNAAADCLSLAFDADDFCLVVSPHIIRNTTRLLYVAGLSTATVTAYVEAILEIVELTGGAVFDVADHDDNLILDLAVATDAILVVSNDTDLTSLSPLHGRIPILRPRDFVIRMVQTRRGR